VLETVGAVNFSSMRSESIAQQHSTWEAIQRVRRSLAQRYGYVVAQVRVCNGVRRKEIGSEAGEDV